jgi:hypothetical protein
MRNIFGFILIFVLGTQCALAQELNCEVRVNAQQITNVNPQIFKTLETALNELVNKTAWGDVKFKQNEKISSSMFFTITEFDSNSFSATLQVQSSRPVYNSIYSSPVLNVNDKDVSFRYIEFENLYFNPNSFDSNLVSIVAFYSYMILGMDADTFQNLGGTDYYSSALGVVNLAQSSGYKGWTQADGFQNRYFLANDFLSNTFNPIREGLYQYHSKGLDKMADNVKEGKESVKAAILSLAKIHSVRPNAYLTRVFFDAKVDEIVSIYSGGPQVNSADLVNSLNQVSPLNASKWGRIK